MSADKKQIPLHSRSGVPLDIDDWTEADWADLHHAIDTAIKRIANRHKPKAVKPSDATKGGAL